jgi:hypothetical protein
MKARIYTIVIIIIELTKPGSWYATKLAELTAPKFIILFIDTGIRSYSSLTSFILNDAVTFYSQL